MTTPKSDLDRAIEVVERRMNADIEVHIKFSLDPRLSQEARDRREHWADCLKDTRDDIITDLRALKTERTDT